MIFSQICLLILVSKPLPNSLKEILDFITENDHEEISEEVEDALAIKLEETVHSLEAKCAGVREELGRMALSEQYMRTKQAQLKAKKKEKEAEEAAKRAAQKELEAAVIAKSDVIVSGLPFRVVWIRILYFTIFFIFTGNETKSGQHDEIAS